MRVSWHDSKAAVGNQVREINVWLIFIQNINLS